MTHTDAMAVGDTQKALGGCMMPGSGGFPVFGDVFGIQETISKILASYAQAGAPFGEIVREISSPFDAGLDMVRQAHLIQTQTALAFQEAFGIEFIPNADLKRFIQDLESGKF